MNTRCCILTITPIGEINNQNALCRWPQECTSTTTFTHLGPNCDCHNIKQHLERKEKTYKRSLQPDSSGAGEGNGVGVGGQSFLTSLSIMLYIMNTPLYLCEMIWKQETRSSYPNKLLLLLECGKKSVRDVSLYHKTHAQAAPHWL